MLIVIAGIKRSASTAQYNLVRIALEMAGYTVNIHGQNYKPHAIPKGEVDLVKIHPFRKELAKKADHIFLTDRNDEDILKSLDRMWDSGNPDRIEGMRKDLEAWKQYSDIPVFHYSEFKRNKMNWVASVIEYLDVNLDAKDAVRLLKEFNKIEPPEDEYDPVTMLFPGHISETQNKS